MIIRKGDAHIPDNGWLFEKLFRNLLGSVIWAAAL